MLPLAKVPLRKIVQLTLIADSKYLGNDTIAIPGCNTVIGASAAGVMTPPFYTIAGKRKSSDWYAPVSGRFAAPPSGTIKRFAETNWFTEEGCIKENVIEIGTETEKRVNGGICLWKEKRWVGPKYPSHPYDCVMASYGGIRRQLQSSSNLVVLQHIDLISS